MKNTKYTKKQITEAIAYWEKQLKAGNYKKPDEVLLNEGLFSWLGSFFSSKDKAGIEDTKLNASPRIKSYLDQAKKYAQKAYAERDWNEASTFTIESADFMNQAWNEATDYKSKDSIAHVAVALAAKLQYAKSNSSYEQACVAFCNKLNSALQNKAKTMTSNALIKKSLSGWSGPDWKKSDKKNMSGVGWNYDPARNGWSYDDGY